MAFPIKKRISTELFTLIGNGGFIYKRISRKLSDLIEEGEQKYAEKKPVWSDLCYG